jgi:hypothetical protein
MKHNKLYLVYYATKEFSTTIWVTAKDKLEARRSAKHKGRFGIRVFRNQKDIDRVAGASERMTLTEIFTEGNKGLRR